MRTARNTRLIHRATLSVLLLAYLFLQVQVAIACVFVNLPGVPCAPGAAPETQQTQNDPGVGADCCQAAYQPTSALYAAVTPSSKDLPPLFGKAPAPVLVAHVDINVAVPLPRSSVSNEASPPGVLGTDIYLTTLRLRI